MDKNKLLVLPNGQTVPFFFNFDFTLREINFPKYLPISVTFWHENNFNEDTKKQIVEYLLELKQSYPDYTFVFENTHETIQFKTYSIVNDIVNTLINSKKFKLNDFMLASAASPVKFNVSSYVKTAQENNWTKIKVMFSNVYERAFLENNNLETENHNNLNISIKKKNKLFLFYNGSNRYHRGVLVSEFLQKGLDKKSYMSAHFNSIDATYQSTVPGIYQNHFKYLLDNPNLLPIKLNDVQEINNISWRINDHEFHHYSDSYLYINTETKFMPSDINKKYEWISHDTSMMDSYFITEKTMKAFIGKMPFIMVGFQNTLAALRELGYKTFHPYIDESYDSIIDYDERLQVIIKEINRLANFSQDQWLEWYEKVHPIAMHNFYHFKNYKPRILFYDPDPI